MTNLQPGRSYWFGGASNQLKPILELFSQFDQVVIDGLDLEVKTLRQLLASLQLAATKQRLAIIKNADQLTEIAQNTLLKLLEEPPMTLTIVLQGEHSQRLLPTVQSRLHQIPIALIKEKAVETEEVTTDKDWEFNNLTKLDRKELITIFAAEMNRQRQQLLANNSQPAIARIGLLDLAIKKLNANANLKLTVDWLLLHWTSG